MVLPKITHKRLRNILINTPKIPHKNPTQYTQNTPNKYIPEINKKYLTLFYLYTLAVSPSLGGSRQHKDQKKQWGFYSVLLAMTRDLAEFGWHCWSNTAHPPPQSSTAYVASRMPSPLLLLPQGCLIKYLKYPRKKLKIMKLLPGNASYNTAKYSQKPTPKISKVH